MTREELTASIRNHLISYTQSIQSDASRNLLSSSVLAEGFVAWMLNTLHPGWNLVNTNQGVSNYPAIDLIDEEQKIAVQVSCSKTPKKVRHTLEEFDSADIPSKDEYKLYIVSITMDKPTKTMLECAKAHPGEVYVWTFDNLYEKITQIIDLATLEALYNGMKREIVISSVEAPPFSLSPCSRVGDGFVGRKGQLLEIQKKLDSGMKPVVLNGLGGIGKTELAIHFGHGYRANCKGHVFFTTFTGSFRETLISMYNHLRDKPNIEEPNPDQMFDAVQDALNKCGSTDILIVDNVDANNGNLSNLLNDTVYKELYQMDIRLILTTRYESKNAINVNTLEKEELYLIFHKHCPDLPQSDMDNLIKAVNGHTLTVDVIARTLADNWVPVSADEMLNAIENSTLSKKVFPEVEADYYQSSEQLHIYKRLLSVFQVANIPETEQSILRCATLLPESGLDLKLFSSALSDEIRKTLPSLGNRGWLTSKNGLVTIHPVIRLVCRTALTPTDENCGDFLNALWGQLDYNIYDRVKYAQLAEVFALAAAQLEDKEAGWINKSGRLRLDLAQYDAARDLYEKHLPSLEERLKDTKPLATVYNNLGSIYGYLGDHSKELEYQLKALDICEKVLPPEHPTLASSYNNVGSTYGNLGDHSKALEFLLKALEIWEKVLPPEHPHLAASYNNVGSTYSALGDHSKALEFQMKALEIREKVLPPDHPDLAQSYNNVGSTYGDLGDHSKALEFKLKALDIFEKVLPPDHPHLATSYNNVGSTYGGLGDHRKALEFLLKALEIREKVLPPDHPDLARSYNNVSCTYSELGDTEKDLEYGLKALEIWEKVLPPEHPDLAISYNNVGMTYVNMEDFPKAVAYLEKALAIMERVLPAEHPNTEMMKQNLAGIRFAAMLQEAGISLADLMQSEDDESEE